MLSCSTFILMFGGSIIAAPPPSGKVQLVVLGIKKPVVALRGDWAKIEAIMGLS